MIRDGPLSRARNVDDVVQAHHEVSDDNRFDGGHNGCAAIDLAVRVLVRNQQLDADPYQQIGRASCRESVCQYVYISVVAVTCNTTHYIKISTKHNNTTNDSTRQHIHTH